MRIYQSESIKELAGALAKAQGEMSHAGKTADNPFFKSKYADLPAVIDAAKPSLVKNGLSVTQFTDIDEAQNIILVTQLNHSSGEWVRGYYPVKPLKPDPQALGSAISYAKRYAYSAITGVASTGEDDDGNAASGNAANKPESAAAAKRRFTRIQNELKDSDDPAATWHEYSDEIKAFQATPEIGLDLYNELVKTAKERKQELQNQNDFKERA